MSSRGKIDDQTDILLSEYALGTLPFNERVALEIEIKRDAELQQRLDWWQSQLVTFSQDIEPVDPPRATFGAVETRLFPNSQAQSSIPEKMRFWRGLSAITAAALVVVATLLAVNLQNNDDAIRDTQLVAQLTGTDTVLRVMASYNPGEQTVRVNRTGGVPRDGRSLQLWLIAGDNPPVSLGLLPDASSGELTVPETALERLASDAVLAISDEPFGGSPTGQPTGAVLVTGSLTEI